MARPRRSAVRHQRVFTQGRNMEDSGIEIPDDLKIRVWDPDSDYRTCSDCGGDCVPEPGGGAGHGIRIMFVCPEHGVHSTVDPFEDTTRQEQDVDQADQTRHLRWFPEGPVARRGGGLASKMTAHVTPACWSRRARSPPTTPHGVDQSADQKKGPLLTSLACALRVLLGVEVRPRLAADPFRIRQVGDRGATRTVAASSREVSRDYKT